MANRLPENRPWFPLVSVVVPCFNEAEAAPKTHKRLKSVLDSLGTDYEIVYVDDGSTDGTGEMLQSFGAQDPKIAVVSLSRNFGHQLALAAGMDHASGDAVVLIDADLQDPPELIPEMVRRWREGYEVVYGVRRRRDGESAVRLAVTRLFYRCICRLSEVPVPVEAADFRLIDRRLVRVLSDMREPDRYLRGMVAWLGFRQCALEYDRDSRQDGRSKYGLSRLARLAVDGIFSCTRNPVAWCYLVALLVVGAGLALLAGALIPPGGGSGILYAVILVLAAGQYLALGLIGEGVGRCLRSSWGRPLYVVDRVSRADDNMKGAERSANGIHGTQLVMDGHARP